jgi:hypothetical protein
MKKELYLVGERINGLLWFIGRDGSEQNPDHAIDYGVLENARRVAKTTKQQVIIATVYIEYDYEVKEDYTK